jgi:hypothetical protein
MLGSNRWGIANPLADRCQIEFSHQLRFSTRPQILKQLGPLLLPSALYDSFKSSTWIQTFKPTFHNDKCCAWFRFFEQFEQMGA